MHLTGGKHVKGVYQDQRGSESKKDKPVPATQCTMKHWKHME